MAREPKFFNDSKGDVIYGFLLGQRNNFNISDNFIERATQSRMARQKLLKKAMQAKDQESYDLIKDWCESFKKECFYYGVKVLQDLQRTGKTKL
jgi:hypothetical protein